MSGTIWMYSDRLDDWDVLFAQRTFITYQQGCDYYDLTPRVMTRLAEEAGAVYKFGIKFVRIRRDILKRIYGNSTERKSRTREEKPNESKKQLY